jgi:ubiquinone/menaquinone biosynthesis C-methylase UbiE
MQAYSKTFAAVYDKKWAAFSHQVAPFLIDFYASTEIGRMDRTILDLCCGAGHLAVHFLEKGHKVVGLDLSEHML